MATTPTTATPKKSANVGSNVNPYTGEPFTTADLSGMGVATVSDFWNFYNQGQIQDGQYTGPTGVVGTGGWGENKPTDYNIKPPVPVDVDGVPCSISGKPPAAPVVTPAPPFELSPEQQAWQDTMSQQVGDWVEAGGYGIPEETQALMIQQQTDTLKAKETEDIRVMRNNMERRGITNSGFVYANEQNIRANTTMAIARSITDLQIQSSLMKMASFEKAMGASMQFLGYLGEMSGLAYQPVFATWQAEEMVKIQAAQNQMDLYKMKIAQAYQQGNIKLAGQIAAEAAAKEDAIELQIAKMTLEGANKQAAASGAGGIFGAILGWIFSS